MIPGSQFLSISVPVNLVKQLSPPKYNGRTGIEWGL